MRSPGGVTERPTSEPLGPARRKEFFVSPSPAAPSTPEAPGDSERRWYHLRPKPRRRTDLMGFNSMWWMALAWLIVIVVAISPVPWW
jgi:hypothetical protein